MAPPVRPKRWAMWWREHHMTAIIIVVMVLGIVVTVWIHNEEILENWKGRNQGPNPELKIISVRYLAYSGTIINPRENRPALFPPPFHEEGRLDAHLRYYAGAGIAPTITMSCSVGFSVENRGDRKAEMVAYGAWTSRSAEPKARVLMRKGGSDLVKVFREAEPFGLFTGTHVDPDSTGDYGIPNVSLDFPDSTNPDRLYFHSHFFILYKNWSGDLSDVYRRERIWMPYPEYRQRPESIDSVSIATHKDVKLGPMSVVNTITDSEPYTPKEAERIRDAIREATD
jgi:hypothetical protein